MPLGRGDRHTVVLLDRLPDLVRHLSLDGFAVGQQDPGILLRVGQIEYRQVSPA